MCLQSYVKRITYSGLQVIVFILLFFSFLNLNINFGYSKEPSQRDGSFEHPKQIFKLIDKKIFQTCANILCEKYRNPM